MSTRTFRFFARLPEFLEMVNELVGNLDLKIIFYKFRTGPSKFFTANTQITTEYIKKQKIDMIYLSKNDLDIDAVDPDNFAPGELGWIQVELPRENNNILLMSDIGIKTDWYDSEKEIIYDNKELLPLYNKFASKLRKKFKFPAKLYRIDNPKKLFICRGIGFTDAVQEFEKHGGELMQYGVLKQRFTTIAEGGSPFR
jgi:hypothetical protein